MTLARSGAAAHAQPFFGFLGAARSALFFAIFEAFFDAGLPTALEAPVSDEETRRLPFAPFGASTVSSPLRPLLKPGMSPAYAFVTGGGGGGSDALGSMRTRTTRGPSISVTITSYSPTVVLSPASGTRLSRIIR